MKPLTHARHAMLAFASRSGLFTLVGRTNWRRQRLCILCFHGIAIADEVRWRPGLYITLEQFASRMSRLNALGATVLSLDEGLRRLGEGTLPERAVVITFDDGGYDFHRQALPVLSTHHFPATLYLTTYYCGRDEPVLSLAADYALWKSGLEVMAPWPELGIQEVGGLQSDVSRRKVANEIVAAMRRRESEPQGRNALLSELVERVGVDLGAMRASRLLSIMSPDEVLDASRTDVAIELHTHRHRTPRDRAAFLGELKENRDVIVRIVGREPNHFCYPSGDVDPCMWPWLADAGIRSATTCQVALAQDSSPRFALPRYLDSSMQVDASFDGWITGPAAFLSRPTPAPEQVYAT